MTSPLISPVSKARAAGERRTPLGTDSLPSTTRAASYPELPVDLPRELGRRGSRHDGPTLIVVGGLHGNEPSGVHALMHVLDTLEGADDRLLGRFVGLVGNRKALMQDRRFIIDDLNRCWRKERVALVRVARTPLSAEDEEMRELDHELAAILDDATDDVYVLDIHSTSAGRLSFSLLDDTLDNRKLAFALPVPQVLGMEEELVGTLLGYLNDLGAVAVGFETGQHADPRSIDRAEAAIWITLERSGVLAPGEWPQVAAARRMLADEHTSLPRVVEVRHRHALREGDGFRMDPGYENFQEVRRSHRLATDTGGPIHPPLDGRILMPLYQGQGEEGYFIVRDVRPTWLWLSATLRRMRTSRFLHWLPGVSRDPELAGVFVVDQARARWLARQLFHLLGYKRLGPAARILRLGRRGPKR